LIVTLVIHDDSLLFLVDGRTDGRTKINQNSSVETHYGNVLSHTLWTKGRVYRCHVHVFPFCIVWTVFMY